MKIAEKLFYKFPFFLKIYHKIINDDSFPGSSAYWEKRYLDGKTSGNGSYGKLALFKAEIINEFVKNNNIDSVIEFGCGDGNQLKLAEYKEYEGIDVSETAIFNCKKLFENDHSKKFYLDSEYKGGKSKLSISLDVIYHLVEDEVFENYMRTLFEASSKYVLIYSSNYNSEQINHVKHRKFEDWININFPNAKKKYFIKNKFPYKGNDLNGSKSDFYIYEIQSKKNKI